MQLLSVSDAYRKNFLQVDLFYKELTQSSVSQQAAYTFENLLGRLIYTTIVETGVTSLYSRRNTRDAAANDPLRCKADNTGNLIRSGTLFRQSR